MYCELLVIVEKMRESRKGNKMSKSTKYKAANYEKAQERFSIRDESAFTTGFTTGKPSLKIPPQQPFPSAKSEDELVKEAHARDYSTPPPSDQTSRQCAYLDRAAVLSEVFTKTQCTNIIENALKNWSKQESSIQRDEPNPIENLDYRNTTQYFPPLPPSPDVWIFENIAQHISEFNSCDVGHGFQVQGLYEPPTLQMYEAPNINKHGMPGKYDWHIDIGGEKIASMRKLSYSILLNPNEYEGGQLVHKISKEEQSIEVMYKEEDLTGAMVLFPSYLLHRITEITKGTRYSLVGWAHGNSYI